MADGDWTKLDAVFGSRAGTLAVLDKGVALFETIRTLITSAYEKVDRRAFESLKSGFDDAHFLLLDKLRKQGSLAQVLVKLEARSNERSMVDGLSSS